MSAFRSLDGDLAFGLYGLGRVHADLEDAVLVGRRDRVGVGARGDAHAAGRLAVVELAAAGAGLLLGALVAAYRVDREQVVLEHDLDVLVGVDAGDLGPDDDVDVMHGALDADEAAGALQEVAP